MAGMSSPIRGVLVLGGSHGTLGLARSLRGSGVAVWHVMDDNRLPSLSRCITRTLRWPGANHPHAIRFLIEAAESHGLRDFLLLPAADPEVKLVSQAFERLSQVYRLPTLPWEQLSWACEKAKAYRRAQDLGIGIPRIYEIHSLEKAASADMRFPVVLKPSMHVTRNPFSAAKAWRADDWESFAVMYERAAGFVGAANVVVQEFVPGGGDTQFSYTGLWNKGSPIAEFTALRRRQFPVEFGTGTFVEVVAQPEVRALGRRFLGSIDFHGLVEIEFKRDPRNLEFKLVDVNPRLWTWFALAEAAGADFGPMLLAVANGQSACQATPPRIGTAWVYLPRDTASACEMMARGLLTPRDYLESYRQVRSWGVFDAGDPLPALCDIPLASWRIMRRSTAT